ncbi:MAG: Ig-like domain-containing protein [Patescibacteria group bacterium]
MNKPDKNFMTLIMVFFLAFGLFITFTTFNGRIATFTRAKEELLPSSETSLMFAWPLTTNTKNSSPVEINVFVRNAGNSPVSNKKVTLTTTLGSLTQSSQTTDKSGKSTFYLTSTTPGLAEITGVIDGQTQLKQKITVKFE